MAKLDKTIKATDDKQQRKTLQSQKVQLQTQITRLTQQLDTTEEIEGSDTAI